MCNLYSITTNQAAIIALFRVINRYIGDLLPMPGVLPDYPAPVVRNVSGARADPELLIGIGSPGLLPEGARKRWATSVCVRAALVHSEKPAGPQLVSNRAAQP